MQFTPIQPHTKETNMNKLIFAILLLFFGNLYARYPEQQGQDTTQHTISFKTHSIQFDLSSVLTYPNFNHLGVSYKRHLSAAHAWRVNGRFGIEVEDAKHTNSNNSYNFNEDRVDTETYLRVFAHYLTYSQLNSDFSYFYGSGPFISLTSRSTEREQINNTDKILIKNENSVYGVGITGIMGIEWLVNSKISLYLENMLILGFEYVEERQRSKKPNDPLYKKNNTFGKKQRYFLKTDQILFGLSYYF